MTRQSAAPVKDSLLYLIEDIERRGRDLALFLVYDRASRVDERPGLALTYFAERCETDDQLEVIITSFREIGAYVELFEGERPFALALASGRIGALSQPLKMAYNGIGWGIGPNGFKAGRKAIVPLLADSFGILCANADPYACVLTRHKFHCFTILQRLGVRTPRCWMFQIDSGWSGGSPPAGTRVIVKSTYEAWSVGVTNESVFTVAKDVDKRVAAVANSIGQDVTVQEFIEGREVYVPVLTMPQLTPLPPVESILRRAPHDTQAVVTINDNLTQDAVQYELYQANPPLVELLQERATDIAAKLGLTGLSRIDFRLDSAGEPWVFDIGISPGLERGGSSYASFGSMGFSYPGFLRAIVAGNLVTDEAVRITATTQSREARIHGQVVATKAQSHVDEN
jgi:D-alanine-D-alanine ligase